MIVLLYAEFALLRQVALILGVVPLAVLGGLIALHVTGVTLNVASAVGVVALFGVAVMNGVIMIANLNRVVRLAFHCARRWSPAPANVCDLFS